MLQTKTSHLWKVRYAVILLGWQYHGYVTYCFEHLISYKEEHLWGLDYIEIGSSHINCQTTTKPKRKIQEIGQLNRSVVCQVMNIFSKKLHYTGNWTHVKCSVMCEMALSLKHCQNKEVVLHCDWSYYTHILHTFLKCISTTVISFEHRNYLHNKYGLLQIQLE